MYYKNSEINVKSLETIFHFQTHIFTTKRTERLSPHDFINFRLFFSLPAAAAAAAAIKLLFVAGLSYHIVHIYRRVEKEKCTVQLVVIYDIYLLDNTLWRYVRISTLCTQQSYLAETQREVICHENKAIVNN